MIWTTEEDKEQEARAAWHKADKAAGEVYQYVGQYVREEARRVEQYWYQWQYVVRECLSSEG